jgi:hypothetical protein
MSWLAISIGVVAVFWFLLSWYRWNRKRVGDINELEYLDELAHEHATGMRDHRERITWLIAKIEKSHSRSAALDAHLNLIREIISKPI